MLNRYRQRLKEYYDNFKDIERLKQKGLVSVENGVVIDRGLASTRLDLESGKLLPIRGPPEGTGKGFTGDYDMWDIAHPDGSRIITNPKHPRFDADSVRRKEELLRELGLTGLDRAGSVQAFAPPRLRGAYLCASIHSSTSRSRTRNQLPIRYAGSCPVRIALLR